MSTPLSTLATSRRCQQNFLAVLPVVETHAKVCFRGLRPEARAEATAETIARAFVDYGRLAKRRRLAYVYPGSLASFAVRAVRGHRRVGGHVSTRDVLDPAAQRKHRIIMASLTPWDVAEGDWREVAVESRRVGPSDNAAFRLDFAEWLAQWPSRHRAIMNTLASGERTTDVAERFGVTLGRISQLRRQYRESWEHFQGMPLINAA